VSAAEFLSRSSSLLRTHENKKVASKIKGNLLRSYSALEHYFISPENLNLKRPEMLDLIFELLNQLLHSLGVICILFYLILKVLILH
jgi:hypothetical protein